VQLATLVNLPCVGSYDYIVQQFSATYFWRLSLFCIWCDAVFCLFLKNVGGRLLEQKMSITFLVKLKKTSTKVYKMLEQC